MNATPVSTSLSGMQEPTLDELWATIQESMEIAERHKHLIYSGEGVAAPESLRGIEKHIAAGIAASVLYRRALARPSTAGLDVAIRRLPRFGVVDGMIAPHPKGTMVRLDDVMPLLPG